MDKYYVVRRSAGTSRIWYVCTYNYDPADDWRTQKGTRWSQEYARKREAEALAAAWNRERELSEARRILGG